MNPLLIFLNYDNIAWLLMAVLDSAESSLSALARLNRFSTLNVAIIISNGCLLYQNLIIRESGVTARFEIP